MKRHVYLLPVLSPQMEEVAQQAIALEAILMLPRMGNAADFQEKQLLAVLARGSRVEQAAMGALAILYRVLPQRTQMKNPKGAAAAEPGAFALTP